MVDMRARMQRTPCAWRHSLQAFEDRFRRVSGHPRLRNSAGKIALQRGSIVYCVEQADNNGDLHLIRVPAYAQFEVLDGAVVDERFAGRRVIQADGYRADAEASAGASLYRYDEPTAARSKQRLTFIPYFCWGNRGEGEMRVWIDADR